MPDPWFEVAVKAIFLCILLYFLGLLFGIVSIFKRGTPKILPSIAILVNGCALLFIAALTFTGGAVPGKLTSVSIVDFGQYEKQSTAALADQYVCIQKTDTITARLGVMFGFRYTVTGDPPRGVFQLEYVRSYPSSGARDSTIASSHRTSSFKLTGRTGETNFIGFTFDHDWELMPGIWTFQIWSDGRKFSEQQFVVLQK